MKDVFLCHASEDKESVVIPLANKFDEAGITYWLDQLELKWGDSLIQEINEGLSKSKYVVVVLSKSFLSKNWPQRELNSVLNIEASTGEVKVLPLVVGDGKEILSQFPLMNDKLYLKWNNAPETVVEELVKILNIPVNIPDEETFEEQNFEYDIPLPKIKRNITQRERDLFTKNAFSEISQYFKKALPKLEEYHKGIETDYTDIHNFKFTCKIYLDGEIKNECLIWMGGLSPNTISYSEGRHIDVNNDNSFHDWITVEDNRTDVYFKASGTNMFDMSSTDKEMSEIDAAEYLWKRLVTSLER